MIFSSFINGIDSRLGRLGRMMRTVDAFPSSVEGIAAENQIRQAMTRCLACRAGSTCDTWLDDMEACGGADAAPDFCPNATRFITNKAA